MIVVGASALLEVLLNTLNAPRVAERLFAPAETLHAPHLIDLEVVQVLRWYALAGDLDVQRGARAVLDLAELPLQRYPHEFLLPRIWQLRNNVTACDAAYLALAETLNCPLVTCDRALAAVPGHDADVEVIT